jgi:ATP-dependent Clp protease ATP-binding subunit ClpC
MFERYTEKARRVIFFARYEASQFGRSYIQSEHLLLGLLREDKLLAGLLAASHHSITSIREEIERRAPFLGGVSDTSAVMPFSDECKRILAYAEEEAERRTSKHIGTEHLLLGLLREENPLGSRILQERGVSFSDIRDELDRSHGKDS